MIGNNIIYDCTKNLDSVRADLLGYTKQQVLIVSLEQLPQDLILNLKSLPNTELIYADLSEDFVNKIASADNVVLISKIQSTSSESYKQIKNIIKKQQKEIIYDILL